jgi:hypothetical protein
LYVNNYKHGVSEKLYVNNYKHGMREKLWGYTRQIQRDGYNVNCARKQITNCMLIRKMYGRYATASRHTLKHSKKSKRHEFFPQILSWTS